MFLAFGQGLDPAALAAGFGMSIVFFIIAIVPDGIGAVEGAMALVFVQLGMAADGGDPGDGGLPRSQRLAPGRHRVLVRATAPPLRRWRGTG